MWLAKGLRTVQAGVFVFRTEGWNWRRRQQVSPKRRYYSIKWRDVILGRNVLSDLTEMWPWTVEHIVFIYAFIYFRLLFIYLLWAGIAQSVWRLNTGWTVRGSNPGEGKIFRTWPDRSWGPPNLLYNGYWVFLGDKAAGAWGYHSPSSAAAKERVKLYIYSPYVTSWPVLGWTVPLHLRFYIYLFMYLFIYLFIYFCL